MKRELKDNNIMTLNINKFVILTIQYRRTSMVLPSMRVRSNISGISIKETYHETTFLFLFPIYFFYFCNQYHIYYFLVRLDLVFSSIYEPKQSQLLKDPIIHKLRHQFKGRVSMTKNITMCHNLKNCVMFQIKNLNFPTQIINMNICLKLMFW